MKEDLLIPALLRLLDTASIRRFKLKDKFVDYNDSVGHKALLIANDMKAKFKIDIFSDKLSNEELTRFEHLIGNVMSNHVKKILVPRKIYDEVRILKESKSIDTGILEKFKISFSPYFSELFPQIKTIKIDTLLGLAKKPLSLSCLSRPESSDLYFSLAIVEIENREVFIVYTLRNPSGGVSEELSIMSFMVLPVSAYSQYKRNPTQLFLKGLDKFGVDMKINNILSRYYWDIEIPLNTNFRSKEFLNVQNIEENEEIIMSMKMRKTSKSIEMQDVFAIRQNLLVEEINKKSP